MWKKLYELSVFIRNYLLDGIATFLLYGKDTTNGRQSVLVVRLDAIGDFILWLDSAVALRKLFPTERYQLVLLGNALWGEFVASTRIFDEYIPVKRNQFYYDIHYRFDIWKTLRSRAWQLAIHPTFSRDCLYGDAAVRMSGAAKRIGSKGVLANQPAWQKWISDRWYTQLLPASDKPLMELERNAEFIRVLGLEDFRAGMPELAINTKLPSKFDARDYIVIVPGGSLALKQWPVERFAELSERIHRMFGFKVIVCGSQSETLLGSRLRMLSAGEEVGWIEDWTGKTSLGELATIIKGAKLLIGNDSSAVHIAAAVGTPAFCVVGGGHFGRFVPYRLEKETTKPMPIAIFHQMECYGCNLKCTKALDRDAPGVCIQQITVDDVWEKLAGLLTEMG